MSNIIRKLLLVAVLALIALGPGTTGRADQQPVDVGTKGCPRPGVNPLPTFRCLYLSEFNLPIAAPAFVAQKCVYFVEVIPSPPCIPGWTATVYLGATAYRIYLANDGRFLADANPVQRPLGTFQTLTVWIDYGTLNVRAAMASFWPLSVGKVNARHAAYAASAGYPAPLVKFIDRDILVPRSALPSAAVTRDTLFPYLQAQGIRVSDYHVIIALDLDLSHGDGGYAWYGGNFIYMGWYWGDTQPLDQYRTDCIAASVYHHEMAHVWGWEHLWTAQETNDSTANCDTFLTAPALFGWTDTDGDRVPEIADATPYGIHQLRLPGIAVDR